MNRVHRLCLLLCSGILWLACEPSQPVTVRPVDMQLEVDLAAFEPDVASPDMMLDMSVVDAGPADAELPDYVEDLAANVAPETGKVFVTGQRDRFDFFWWRGGRVWSRSSVAERAPSPVDESLLLTVLEHSQSEFRTFVPPFIDQAYALRPAGWPVEEVGFLVVGQPEAWLSYNLSNADAPINLELEAGALKIADRTFGPTSPSQALVIGKNNNRIHVTEPRAGAAMTPVGERNSAMPVSVSAMGHLWLFAYLDGHCTTFTAADTIGEEVGNWRCFSNSETHVLGRDAFSSDAQGPAMVQHDGNTLRIWDPRPGVVTDPKLVPLVSSLTPTDLAGLGLPEGWLLHESLGHQVLTMGDEQLTYVGRFGDTLAFSTVSEAQNVDPNSEGESSDGTSSEAAPDGEEDGVMPPAPDTESEQGSETNSETNTAPDSNSSADMEDDSTNAVDGEMTDSDEVLPSESSPNYWVLVSRDAIVIVEKSDIALGAFLVLDGEPVHVIWDGVSGEITAVPLNIYTRLPLLPIKPETCPNRSVESCGLTDSDCDGQEEGGVCCPFTYLHSDVSTLNEPGAFVGDWFISLTDLGALLAAQRRDRVEFLHLESDSDPCFACATGLGPIKAFAHSDAVVAVAASRIETEETCPQDCDVIVSAPNSSSSDESDSESDSESESEMEMSATPSNDVIMVHPAPGEIVFRDPNCDVQFLESISSGISVALVALCPDRALVYEVMNNTLSDVPLTVDLGEPLVWVGPQIKYIFGGRYVVEWLTAHGADFTLRAWRFGLDGLVEIGLPDQLSDLTVEQRSLPIRMPIALDGVITRKNDAAMTLESLSETGWQVIPSHLWARDIRFSKYEDFAVSVAELRDPTTPGFDPIEQTLAVYGHDLSGIDSPWGQELELESSPILGYSFQGVVLPEWDHYSLEPNIWWAVGRDTLAPTIKRLGLTCQSTIRLQEQKAAQP